MSEIVIDASALGALLLPDEGGDTAKLAHHHLGNSTVLAPRHFPIEVLSLVGKALRRGRINADQHDRIVGVAERLVERVTIDAEVPLRRIAGLVGEYGLSAYDAAYLELSMRSGARLLSGDGKLGRVASGLGLLTPIQP